MQAELSTLPRYPASRLRTRRTRLRVCFSNVARIALARPGVREALDGPGDLADRVAHHSHGAPVRGGITLEAGPVQMGILSGAAGVSVLLFGLFAGAWADRVAAAADPDLHRSGRGRRCSSTIPIAAMRHSLTMTHLYVVAAAAGLLTVLFDVSYQAYVPSLVQRENLVQANAKLALSESVAEVSGPGIAGFLVTALTAPIAILFDAASFLVSAVSIALVRTAGAAPRGRAHADSHIGREIAEGLRFSWRNPYLRAMGLRSATAALFMGFFGEPVSALHGAGVGPFAGGDRGGGRVRRRIRAGRGRAVGEIGPAVGVWPGVPVRGAVHQLHDVPAPAGARLGGDGLRIPDCGAAGGFRLAEHQYHGDEPAAGFGAAAHAGTRELGDESAVQRPHSGGRFWGRRAGIGDRRAGGDVRRRGRLPAVDVVAGILADTVVTGTARGHE